MDENNNRAVTEREAATQSGTAPGIATAQDQAARETAATGVMVGMNLGQNQHHR